MGFLRRREVTAVSAARATPAMGLEVREVGPIETPRHRVTVYLLATTVPPTVVALLPKGAIIVARAQFPQMGIDPGLHQPMQMIPSMHIKSPEAIITDEGGIPSHAQRAAPAAWRPVGRRLPRPLGRASAISGAPIRPSAGPACRARRVGYAPRVARAGQRGRPLAPVPASPPRRQPPPLASSPPFGYRVPRRRRRSCGGPLAHRGPRSTTLDDCGGDAECDRRLALPVGAVVDEVPLVADHDTNVDAVAVVIVRALEGGAVVAAIRVTAAAT